MYIYVAGPYTKGDVIINVREAVKVGDRLRLMGHVPYIPHLSMLWHLILPHEDIDYWYQFDLEWLKKCDALFRFPGESKGADTEVEVARAKGLPVYFTFEEVP
jgi:hypothetical protein